MNKDCFNGQSIFYVWTNILWYLNQRFGSVTVEAWLSDAVVKLDEKHLVIVSPQEFRREIIRKRLLCHIQDAIKELYGVTSIEIEVCSSVLPGRQKVKVRKSRAIKFDKGGIL